MASKSRKHYARSGDIGRMHGIIGEPEIWKDDDGEYHVTAKLRRGSTLIIADRTARPKRLTRRKRRRAKNTEKQFSTTATLNQKST